MKEALRKLQESGIPNFGIAHFFPTDGNSVYIRQMHLMKDHHVATHKHTFEHYAILGLGMAEVEVDGVAVIHEAPSVVVIKAGQAHKITALTDITWFCVHGTNEVDAEEIEKVLIE